MKRHRHTPEQVVRKLAEGEQILNGGGDLAAVLRNPFAESFNSRARDELFNVEEFATLLEAQVIVEAWRIEYNTYRPHSSLGDLTLAEYAATWTNSTQPALS